MEHIGNYLGVLKSKPIDLIIVMGDQATHSLLSTRHPLLYFVPVVACNVHFPDEDLLKKYESRKVYALRDTPDFKHNMEFIRSLQPHVGLEIVYNIDLTPLGHKSFDLLNQVVDRKDVQILGHKSAFSMEYEYKEMREMIEFYNLMPAVANNRIKKNELTISLCPFRYIKGASLLVMMENSKSEQGKKAFLLDKFDMVSFPIVNALSIPSFSCVHAGFGEGNKIVGGYMATKEISVQAAADLSTRSLRYWVMSFHVDGFKLLGDRLPVTAIVQDALLSRTKILYDGFDMSVVPQNRTYENLYIDKEEYQFAARMMLNHINCNMYELLNQQKKQGENVGFINYISSNNGFTLSDLFMYNDRHNEANGEKNADGPSWNFSNNYGCEGPSRKRFIREIRKLKWKDAMLLLFLAQGVPMIMAGDEICNSQDGNNNAYCQDNPTGWVNWSNEQSRRENIRFLTRLIKFRDEHPVISCPKPFKFSDYKAVGYPDLSYHCKNAWIGECDATKLCVGVMYCGDYNEVNKDYVYVAYNFYSSREKLALPKLKKGMKWYKVCDSTLKEPFYDTPVLCENQQYADVSPQSVYILIGR